MTIMLPFLPHYLGTLGDYSERDTYLWSSLIYSLTFITAALFAPLWGRVSDAHGCKINLVRASVGMFFCMTLMGFATTAWQMAFLRLLAGVAGGYTSGATILMAKEAPESHAGQAQGVLFACILSGSLAGPMLGGFLSAYVGMREAFLLSGALILLNVLATVFLVREAHVSRRHTAKDRSRKRPLNASIWALLIATMALLVANLSVEPIIYSIVDGIDHEPLATSSAAGIVLSATALGSLLSALCLGRLADRYGAMRVAMVGFGVGAVLIVPQAFATDAYTLALLRFAMGLALGGVLPCLKAAIKHLHADAGSLGHIMGLSTSFQYIGQVAGPMMGGVVAAYWGMATVFHVTAAVALACALMLAAVTASASQVRDV
ncbi:MFS family permease [Halomonas organivorans]|uniref:MFS family permease n=2 Tax=Halomonas organivorans TaxID=257772 RepID=A0A7W5G434_9GAMM|nr:MFS family permease [Halomonas organivorans]